jgi:uncharacterized protein (DUF2267 family)
MNYEAFSNDSLTMMYEGVRGSLAADDALARQAMEIRRIWMRAPWEEASGLQRPLPNTMLRIIASGEREDPPPQQTQAQLLL